MNTLCCSQRIGDQIQWTRNRESTSKKILRTSYLLRMPSTFLFNEYSVAWIVLAGSHILKDKKLKREKLFKVLYLSLSNRVISFHPAGATKKLLFLNQDFTIHKSLFLHVIQPFWISNFYALPTSYCSSWTLLSIPQEAKGG